MKYEDWLMIWIDDFVKPTAKSRTYKRYNEIIHNHIIPNLGNYDLKNITPILLQKYTAMLLQSGNLVTGRGLAPSTVNTIITIIQNSLKVAVTCGEVENYTAGKIKRPKAEENSVACFTLSEQKRIEQKILQEKSDRFFGIILCLYTGLRIGELLALTWEDINFAKGTLSVTKSCYDGKSLNGKSERIFEIPKTKTSQRIIPLPKQILSKLKEIQKKSKCNFVVSNGNKFISVRSYQRSFATLLKNLKIPHKNFHSLRHTFATRALECGMDVKTLSEILGHKNATITLERYAHSLIEHKKEMMNKVGKLLE